MLLKHCIKLDTPQEKIEDAGGCSCYKRTLFFLYRFRFYELECCRGWFNYIYQKEGGMANIINTALKSESISSDIHNGWPFQKRWTQYFREVCTWKPDMTINVIPILDIIENTEEYVSGYWNSYYKIGQKERKLCIRHKWDIQKLHDYNIHQLEKIIAPGFIKKSERQQIEILVKQLRKTIRNANN